MMLPIAPATKSCLEGGAGAVSLFLTCAQHTSSQSCKGINSDAQQMMHISSGSARITFGAFAPYKRGEKLWLAALLGVPAVIILPNQSQCVLSCPWARPIEICQIEGNSQW